MPQLHIYIFFIGILNRGYIGKGGFVLFPCFNWHGRSGYGQTYSPPSSDVCTLNNGADMGSDSTEPVLIFLCASAENPRLPAVFLIIDRKVPWGGCLVAYIVQGPAVRIPIEGIDTAHPGQGAGSVADFGGFELASDYRARKHYDIAF